MTILTLTDHKRRLASSAGILFVIIPIGTLTLLAGMGRPASFFLVSVATIAWVVWRERSLLTSVLETHPRKSTTDSSWTADPQQARFAAISSKEPTQDPTLLLIEAKSSIRQTVANRLQEQGFFVAVASDLAEVSTRFSSKFHADVVIADIDIAALEALVRVAKARSVVVTKTPIVAKGKFVFARPVAMKEIVESTASPETTSKIRQAFSGVETAKDLPH